MSTAPAVVVVGSGLAGYTLATQLAALGYPGSVTLVGEEAHAPYDRPPLSKEYQLGDESAVALQPALAPRVRFMAGQTVVAIHSDAREVELADGRRLPWDRLVLATGTRARQLPGIEPGAQVLTLRTLDDARAIREKLRSGARLAVIGGGPIGLELAASAHQLGVKTTVIEAAERLMARSAPVAIAEILLQHHRAHGVQVELNAKVIGIKGGNVELAGGRRIEADLVVVGIGVVANDQLARAAGIAADDGIFVDALCRTTHPGVYAIGDVTRQRNPISGRFERIETWFNAQGQALALAQQLAGTPQAKPYDDVPWYWSDQGKLRLQCAGLNQGEVQASRGDPAGSYLLGQWSAGRLVGVAAINSPHDFNLLRRLIGTEENITPEQFTSAPDLRWLQQHHAPPSARALVTAPAAAEPDSARSEQPATSSAAQPTGLAVCPLNDIDEGGIGSTYLEDGTRIAIYRVRGEEVFATDDKCTHGASSLCDEGTLEGHVIECGLHLGSFDVRTGKPVSTPCTKAVRTYAAQVRNGTIWIATEPSGESS
ncbi:FAD-dependent oxidoreductase [Ramlibacter sp. AW1]|uniref:FAD-dependent oxidoreductase n=1 Tax=Ramlibacter aurantiacus TaxID=2801330 RepID=A0A936ZLL4_9BURK|nr:FAD-dependent oxidoreductase [Ramlibacter aurantiacus]MBL0422443.1 FAD-dependent oxidoreductase [Ramlibacter aurantiacus]